MKAAHIMMSDHRLALRLRAIYDAPEFDAELIEIEKGDFFEIIDEHGDHWLWPSAIKVDAKP